MHLPASKDGTSLGTPLEKLNANRKVVSVDGTPASPSSPSKTAREKPQKVLPCPRCESMNTKFCYYNNYSVNQPRHFCRQCQRYWTVGGTLRNVPVGGGSRKKNRHQRGEPYLRTGPAGTGSPLAMATPGMVPPLGAFQHPLPHDMTGFNFSQLPGFVPQNHPFGGGAFPMDQSSQPMPGMYINPLSNKPGGQQEFPVMQPMYGAMNPHAQAVGASFYPDLGALQLEHQNPGGGGVKAEFWGNHHVMQSQGGNGNGNQAQMNQGLWEQSKQASGGEDQVGAKTGNSASLQTKSGGYESSMLLHLGLNSRPQMNGKSAAWNNNQDHTRGGHPVNGTSPPHGSSTIEEEGSTPTNGYSNSGYEEGDTVSSMWQEMHDMHDIFQ
ncbi:hypothetical protein M758_1G297900 [Ceratodon purpureus]|uniref:Dof-type domain-containing protein n=1 Tax=Ceratodon purpureus TaxID=3225 RepID=A0A8T0JBE8_CERPU|nr:hypothetical protein KC19_1G304800 [Ceratodon purpureus]KAG0632013.1 hypothetical protein M758_1G297900 [Ceratodon purpureus]